MHSDGQEPVLQNLPREDCSISTAQWKGRPPIPLAEMLQSPVSLLLIELKNLKEVLFSSFSI